MLQPKYTMHGFNWLDRRGVEGIGFVRAIRTLLTSNIPYILPQIRGAISESFGKLSKGQRTLDSGCLVIFE